MNRKQREAVVVDNVSASLRYHSREGKLETIWVNLFPSFTFKFSEAYDCFFDRNYYDIILSEFKHDALEKGDVPRVLTIHKDAVEFITDMSEVEQ